MRRTLVVITELKMTMAHTRHPKVAVRWAARLVFVAALVFPNAGWSAGRGDGPAPATEAADASPTQTRYRTVEVEGLQIFYREAGPRNAPTILLLHGFPASSHMFRNLIPALANRFHVVAPDYPGFGNSSMPPADAFNYTFDRLAHVIEQFTEQLGLTRYALYMHDYGAPIGFRLAVKHPQRVSALIIQNGNAYDEGLREFWDPFKTYWRDPTDDRRQALARSLELDGTKWVYTHGVRQPEAISPDNWFVDQYLLDRPGSKDIQLRLFYDYRSNPPLYSRWQEYFRRFQPPALVVWGKNDQIFPAEGAHAYRKDLKDVELHLLDTGHFALEEESDRIGALIRAFLESRLMNQ
ncbi:MAG TPA: alpha/beta fold hydrolase [Vicinamibacterales bacterium]|nr:alpha/beta fold hydrolase [Vicinamibacterales bacterium]